MSSSATDSSMTWPDIVVIVVYFFVVLGTGLWASCRAKNSSASGFFLASKTMHWIPIGCSTFSTNIGASMFVGLAGSAAANGVAVTMFEWHAMWMLLLLGWIFLPVYIASGCFTMPDYLRLRFGGRRIQVWLAVIFTLITIISRISGQLYAGAVFIQQIFKLNLYLGIALILAVTSVFTILGGMTAVIWTDTIQTVMLVGGGFAVSAIALWNVGGYEQINNRYLTAAANYTYLNKAIYGNHSCGFPPDNALHIFRSVDDSNYPWPGMVFGLTILALNAWCMDQTSVQRSMSARNMSHAKAGLILAAYLKVLSFIFFIIPGMISRILFPDEVACATPDDCRRVCDNPSGCTDIAYPLLVLRILPQGVRGIMMAALLSALVSSLTSFFNSSSTVMAMDLWPRWRPRASERELMVVGRIWILILVAIGLTWLPVLELVKGSQYWAYAQAISSFLIPPIVMTFLLGIFWTRTTEQGAFWGLMAGFAVGVIRMGLDWSRTGRPCGSDQPDTRFPIVAKIHYLHFAMILAAVSSAVIVAVSIVTKPRSEKKLRRVTWWTRHSKELPELSDDDETSNGEDTQKNAKPGAADSQQKHNGLTAKYLLLKWFCGVDLLEKKVHMTKEQIQVNQLASTNIQEDPFWKNIVNINGVVCCACCCFLHGFWA